MDDPVPNLDERSALNRISSSRTLRDSEALRKLLQYLGGMSLTNRAEQLKEYTVGVEALGRPTHYDPRTDSSARALAARLRRKLEEYYRSEGAEDPVHVALPKGGFKLTFQQAEARPMPAGPGSEARAWKLVAAGCLALSLASLSLWLFRGKVSQTSPWNAELRSFWEPFLDERTPILVSFGSPLFLKIADGFVRWPAINDWDAAQRSRGVSDLAAFLHAPTPPAPNFDYAGVGDVHGAFLVARLLASQKPAQLSLKRGVVLSWEDIKNNHLVFIGNGKNQDKLRDILTNRDFVVEEGAIRNLKPRPGEPPEFREGSASGSAEARTDYALITYLPGLEQGRYMLLLSAMNTESIWGAVEAVTNPKFVTPLVSHLRSGGVLPRAFQAVLRIHLGAGVPVEVNYATHHILRPPE